MQHVWPLVDIMHAAYTHDNIGLKPSYQLVEKVGYELGLAKVQTNYL